MKQTSEKKNLLHKGGCPELRFQDSPFLFILKSKIEVTVAVEYIVLITVKFLL